MFMQAIPRDSSANEVLIIGGCHVTGWRIGDSPCFWSGAANYWSDGRRTTRYGHASFDKAVRLLQGSDVDPYGTLLILQIGNFEAQEIAIVRPFISRMAKFLSRAKNILRKLPKQEDPGEVTVLSKNNELKLLIAGGILLALEIFIPDLFRKKRISRISDRLERLLDVVLALNVQRTIVLSTFPTASPAHNFYRSKLNTAMHIQAEKRGFTYIDVFAVLEDAKSSGKSIAGPLFADGAHLTARGHALISKAITDRLDTGHLANRYAFETIAA